MKYDRFLANEKRAWPMRAHVDVYMQTFHESNSLNTWNCDHKTHFVSLCLKPHIRRLYKVDPRILLTYFHVRGFSTNHKKNNP